MKINSIPTIIAAAISALIAYALYAFCKTEGQELLLAICGGISMFVTLATCLGVRFPEGRTSANVAVLGGVFFALLLIAQLVFAFVPFTTPALIIVDGLLLLVFLLVAYGVTKARQ